MSITPKTQFEAREKLVNVGVLVVEIDGRQDEYVLTGVRTTVGRNKKADVRIADGAISNFHAVIYNRNYEYYIKDCKSSNSSVVNGQKVTTYELVDKQGEVFTYSFHFYTSLTSRYNMTLWIVIYRLGN
jgi:pSer/pThr/pTyr-binding forkhead associated (FHA) protein